MKELVEHTIKGFKNILKNSEIFDGELLSEIKISTPYPPNTIGWWLNKLEEPERTQALNNYKEHFWGYYDKKTIARSILTAIDMAFDWEKTPEDYEYWYNIQNKYKNQYLDEIKLNIQEGTYGDYLFGDKETGVKIKWYDEEKEEDTPAEKELFTRLKAYADSEFETYSTMNIDDLKPLFDKLKAEYPDIVNPQLTSDTYIYRGTTTTIEKLEELKQLPNISEDKRNIIIPNQEYKSQRLLSSWSTNYFNAASFAIATAERKGMVPLVVRAKAGDAKLYFNPDFMNKLSSQPEEEILNSTNPINVDILIIKGFDTELYDDENLDEIKVSTNRYPEKTAGWWFLKLPEPYRTQAINNWKDNWEIFEDLKDKKFNYIQDALEGGFVWKNTPEKVSYWVRLYDSISNPDDLDEIKVNQPITKPIVGKVYDILMWYNPERIHNDLYEPEKGTENGKEGWYWSKGWKWDTKDGDDGKLEWIDTYDPWNTREYNISEKIRLNKDNLSEIKINPGLFKFPMVINSIEDLNKLKPLLIRGGYTWCDGSLIQMKDLVTEDFPRRFYIRPGIDKNICSDYIGEINEIKVNLPWKPPTHFPIKVTEKDFPKITKYLYDLGYRVFDMHFDSFCDLGYTNEFYFNKLKHTPTNWVNWGYIPTGINVRIEKQQINETFSKEWWKKTLDLDEIKVTVPINFPITVSSAEEFKSVTDKLYKKGYRYIWKALNNEGIFKPDPFTDWMTPAKEIVIDYINLENHPDLSQENWEVLKDAKLLDYEQSK